MAKTGKRERVVFKIKQVEVVFLDNPKVEWLVDKILGCLNTSISAVKEIGGEKKKQPLPTHQRKRG